jgi:glycosyltransferase involved in cell wall biosynthesis
MTSTNINLPFVSVLTPTYNRRRFIPALITCFKHQDYPIAYMEWIILDDGSDKVGDIFAESGLTNVRYYKSDARLTIGAKRNKLNDYAKGVILVCMDDDDYYPPERVSFAVWSMMNNPTFSVCGSSELYLYYSDDKAIYKLGPYGISHATNGTLAYRRSYTKNHRYDETVTKGEESSFLNGFTVRMLQLDARKTQLLMSHSENTFDKRVLRERVSPMVQLTDLRLEDFIADEGLRAFYEEA